jgi:hypothetical protein
VQALLLNLIRPDAAPSLAAAVSHPPATIAQLDTLWDEVHGMARVASVVPAIAAIRSHLRSKTTDEQQALALRWLIEFAKGDPPTRR